MAQLQGKEEESESEDDFLNEFGEFDADDGDANGAKAPKKRRKMANKHTIFVDNEVRLQYASPLEQ
tara:strand:- start:923 stop:1120 length:198 start_codon:yes stop_codon:yes gene_type:complete